MSIRNVADYGADHVTPGFDNTAIIQSVIDAGPGRVILPEYYGTGKLYMRNGVEIEAASRAAGIYRLPSLDPNIHNVGLNFGDGVGVSDAGASRMRISGFKTGLLLGGGVNGSGINRMLITDADTGLLCRGDYRASSFADSIGHRIRDIRFLNINQSNMTLHSCADIDIENVQTDTRRLAVGLLVESYMNSLRLRDYNASGCSFGLLVRDTMSVASPAGIPTKPHALFFNQFLGDSCDQVGNAILHGYDMKFVDCWAGGSQNGDGWQLGNSDGYLKDIELIGCRSFLNAKHGVHITGNNPDSRIRIKGGSFEDNGWASKGAYAGIYAGPNIHRASVYDASCTDTRSGTNKTQGWGVKFETHAASSFNLGTGIDARGNINSPGVTFGFTAGGNVFNNNRG